MILRIWLPWGLGGLVIAFIFSLYLLNNYHRIQLESYLYNSAATPSITEEFDEVIDLTKNEFFILYPNLANIFFIKPDKTKKSKIISHSGKTLIIENHIIYQRLRHTFNLLFFQTLFIVLSFCGILYFLIHITFLKPLKNLTNSINDFQQEPESAMPQTHLARKDEIGAAQQALNKMQTTIKAQLLEKTRLAGIGLAVSKISHDLRNILANAQLLSENFFQTNNAPLKQQAQRLSASLNRAIALCSQYLSYASAKKSKLAIKQLNLKTLADEIGGAVLLQHKNCSWQNKVPPHISFSSDKNALFRILFNLGKNAAQAGAGKISLNARAQNNQIKIEMRDNGAGLPLRVRANLFMPFTSSTKKGSGQEGFGLGLSIAQELARELGGNLTLKETNKQGTCFCLTLSNS